MMHRFLLSAVSAATLALAVPAIGEAAGGAGAGGGHGMGLSLGGGGGHGGMGLSLGGGSGHGGSGHVGMGLGGGSLGLGEGHGALGLGGSHSALGLGGSRSGLGLGRGSGLGHTGYDDIHLGLSSRELGLGNNFGLDGPDNVLSRAARLPTTPMTPIGRRADDRPSFRGLDANMTSHDKSQPSGNDTKPLHTKKETQQTTRAAALEALELDQLEQSDQAQLEQIGAAQTPFTSTPARGSTSTPAPTMAAKPEVSPAPAIPLGSGDVSSISAYFAGHSAPVASIPTTSVNVSVGGTVPNGVALFPPPFDLINQVSDPNFLYFVWGQNVVIVDAETHVVNTIIPNVIAHQA